MPRSASADAYPEHLDRLIFGLIRTGAYYTDPLQRSMIQAWRHLLLHAFC
jgi:hypothetical protein